MSGKNDLLTEPVWRDFHKYAIVAKNNLNSFAFYFSPNALQSVQLVTRI